MDVQGISLGRMCTAIAMLKKLGWKKKSYPLDWAKTPSLYETYGLLVKNNFDGFYDLEPCLDDKNAMIGYRNNRYNFELYHGINPCNKDFEQLMPRRIKRFNDVLHDTETFVIFLAYREYDREDWEKTLEVFKSTFNNVERSFIVCVQPGSRETVSFKNIFGYDMVVAEFVKPANVCDWDTLFTGCIDPIIPTIVDIVNGYVQ